MEAKLISSLLVDVDPVSTRLTALQKRVSSLGEVSEALPAAHKQLMDVQTQLMRIHFLLTRPEHPLSDPLRDAVRLNAVHVDAHLRRTQSVLARIEAHILKNQASVLRFLRTDSVCKELNQVLHATASMRASCQGLITEILLGKLRDSSADDKRAKNESDPGGDGDGDKIAPALQTDDRAPPDSHDDEAAVSGTEPRAMRLSDVPPSDLPSALRAVLVRTHTPAQCLPLIQARATTRSLAAWYAAHELLMLAVADDAALCSAHYAGVDSYWLQQLYQRATLLRLPDETERARVVRCLREAEAAGLVEVAAAVIGDIFVAQSLSAQMESAARADTELWTRLLQAERGLDELTESLKAYRRAQRYSQLVGVALQLIPLAGGALAGILSAGADVTAGVEVKDIVEAVLGYGVEGGSEVADSVRDRFLERARGAVSEQAFEGMEESKRQNVMGAIEQSGMSVSVLRDLLDSRNGVRISRLNGHEGEGDGKQQREAVPSSPEGCDKASSQSTGQNEADAFSVEEDEGESFYVVGLTTDEPARKLGSWWHRSAVIEQSIGHGREGGTGGYRSPSQFCQLYVNGDTAAGLEQEEMAKWWAAYSLNFDDGKSAAFNELWPSLLAFLVEEELYGVDLAVCDEDAQAVSIAAVRAAKGSAKRLPFGRKRRLVRFIAELSSL